MSDQNKDPDQIILDLKMIYFELKDRNSENANEQSNSSDD